MYENFVFFVNLILIYYNYVMPNKEVPSAPSRRPKVRSAEVLPEKDSIKFKKGRSELMHGVNRPLISKKPPEKPKYFNFRGLKLRILSKKEQERAGVTMAKDLIMPQLKKDRKFPSKEQVAQIRKRSEFYDPHNTGLPVVEVTKKDLDKVVSKYGYKLREFLKVDPKDLDCAKDGTCFDNVDEEYRRITRLDVRLIERFEELHAEVYRTVNGPRRKNKKIPEKKIRLIVDEAFRPYGENLQNYFKKLEGEAAEQSKKQGKTVRVQDLKPPKSRKKYPISFGSMHTVGKALDIKKTFLVDGVEVSNNIVEKAAERLHDKREDGGLGKHGSAIIHIDSRAKKGTWGY